MIESFIRNHSGDYKKRTLWESLPETITYQAFSTIITHLQDSGKIAVDTEGKICWIHNQKLIKKYGDNTDLKVR